MFGSEDFETTVLVYGEGLISEAALYHAAGNELELAEDTDLSPRRVETKTSDGFTFKDSLESVDAIDQERNYMVRVLEGEITNLANQERDYSLALAKNSAPNSVGRDERLKIEVYPVPQDLDSNYLPD